MFGQAAFSGFSVDDIEAARQFYGNTLGLNINEQPGMGFHITFPTGQQVFVYAKDDHQPATFTVLNFPVDDIDAAIDELAAKAITMDRPDTLPAPLDDKGVLRGLSAGYGPDIAWFKDPAGNVLSVLQDA